jgi:hypothetical protein
MNVICGVNGETWQEAEIFVCHHCGMPVCTRDGVTIANDDAFDASHAPVSRAAMHCPTCAEEYHRGGARYHGWTDPRAVAAPARAPQPAPGGYGGAPDQARARAAGGR